MWRLLKYIKSSNPSWKGPSKWKFKHSFVMTSPLLNTALLIQYFTLSINTLHLLKLLVSLERLVKDSEPSLDECFWIQRLRSQLESKSLSSLSILSLSFDPSSKYSSLMLFSYAKMIYMRKKKGSMTNCNLHTYIRQEWSIHHPHDSSVNLRLHQCKGEVVLKKVAFLYVCT